MQISNRSRILFLIFVVLGIYYPSLFGEANSIDDVKMLGVLSECTHTDWKTLFIPVAGTYYRPLLWSTFVADYHLWHLSESFMHLENILLHAANTVLVFVLAAKVLPVDRESRSEFPMLSALLFALHPINTESVSWISGRTDPLAALFVLSAALFLVKGLQENRYRHLALATVFIFLGCLSKEVALFFLPAACFIVLCHDAPEDAAGSWFSVAKVKRLAVMVGPFFLCGVAYLYLRFSSFSGGAVNFLQLVFGRNRDPLEISRMVFKVFGFYAKKLFLPLPLNFAIFSASDRYAWVGVIAFLFLLFIARGRRMLPAFAVAAGILILPAILVALTHVAWTPLAERYLYLPSAFFSVALVGCLQYGGERAGKATWPQYAVMLLLFPAAFFTVQRNVIWQNNLSLFQDTLHKSPESAAIKNELAIALANSGRMAEAGRHLESAQKQDPEKKSLQLYVNQAELLVSADDLEGARKVMLEVIKAQKEPDPFLLRRLAKIDEKRLFKPISMRETRMIYREILEIHESLYSLTRNPIDLYRGGQMALRLDEKEKARTLFEKAYLSAPDGTYFKPAAKKLAEKLR